MKTKKVLLVYLMSIGYNMMSQVGVYTKTPNVSMEIKTTNNSQLPANGLLLPRLTISQLDADASRYGTNQHGTLVYVTNAPGTGPTTSDILIPGFYYYNSTTQKWKLTDKNTSLELKTVPYTPNDSDGNPLQGVVLNNYTLIYKDEEGIENQINMNALVEAAETLTSLTYNGEHHELIYTDEKLISHKFNLVDLVGDTQTITSLTLDIDNKRLIYIDENEVSHSLNLAPIIQEPWYNTATNTGATSNNDNIYTRGWVGIGYSTPSAAPNEKLRVNGSISAVNNYYADYVFEDYFEGNSKIKSDYKFKSLEEIQNYIEKNKHLPGITPINQLEKNKDGYSINISELTIQLLEKTEELYLHTIEQENKINEQSKQIQDLQESLKRLEQLLNSKEK